MIEILGWLGALFLALCMLPQTLEAIRTKGVGMNVYSLVTWAIGILCMTIYTPLALGWDWPLMCNYFFNLTMGCILIYYKVWK